MMQIIILVDDGPQKIHTWQLSDRGQPSQFELDFVEALELASESALQVVLKKHGKIEV